MTADEPLVLFSRQDCHLCEVTARMLADAGVHWQAVDIDEDPQLANRYGVHVPVLRLKGSGQELFFPFDREQLLAFISGES